MSQRMSDKESKVRLPSALWYWSEAERVRFRQDCRHGERPCRFISCEHHLLMQADPDTPNRWYVCGQEINQMEHTCGLDLLEKQGFVPITEPLQGKPLPELDTPCEVVIGSPPPKTFSSNEASKPLK